MHQFSSASHIPIHHTNSFLNHFSWIQAQIKANITNYIMKLESSQKIKHINSNLGTKNTKTNCNSKIQKYTNIIPAQIQTNSYINYNDWPASNSMNTKSNIKTCWIHGFKFKKAYLLSWKINITSSSEQQRNPFDLLPWASIKMKWGRNSIRSKRIERLNPNCRTWRRENLSFLYCKQRVCKQMRERHFLNRTRRLMEDVSLY